MSWARLSAHADRAALDFMGGVSVIAGAVSGRGFLEENKELVFDDGVEIVPSEPQNLAILITTIRL
jgi:hypothetical protein